MKKILLLLIVMCGSPVFSQTVNDYQYVIVPAKFDIFKEKDLDKYRLNTMTKLLLQKYGFKSYLSNEDMPQEASNNRCGVLYATLKEDNGFFATKIKVMLKDCQDKVVYETEYGSSREKEFAVAYNQALREAFKSFDKLNYKYTGKETAASTQTVAPNVSAPSVVEPVPAPSSDSNSDSFYFAQPIANGFQVVNSEPKVIMRLFNTSQKNVFIAEKGDAHGLVLVKNNQWFFEYYESGKLVSEPLKLKF